MALVSRPTLRQAHRWLGLIFSVSVLLSAGSGVIHNVMTRTQPPPPAARPAGPGLEPGAIRLPVAEALAALPKEGGPIRAINVRNIGGEPWYQVFREGAPLYYSALDGRADATRDAAYAAEIASAALGGAPVREAGYLTAFDAEYISIFRILPVYKFSVEDGRETRVYVSTLTGSVTRHTDRRRQWEANLFSNLHKFAFIPNKDARDFVLTTLTAGVALASALGVVLFFATRPPRRRR